MGTVPSQAGARIGTVPCLVLALALTSVAAPAAAQALPEWMAGCWSGERGGERFTEHWVKVDDVTLVGMAHTVRRGRMASFEYLRVVIKNGRAVYIAQPGGAAPTEFTATANDGAQVTFENAAHDFPTRVSYRLVDATHVTAWIDGGPSSSRRIEFPMARVSCEP